MALESLSDILHRIAAHIPWRQESDAQEVHSAIEEVVAKTPEGRNATPAGIVEQIAPEGTSVTGGSFPSNPQE